MLRCKQRPKDARRWFAERGFLFASIILLQPTFLFARRFGTWRSSYSRCKVFPMAKSEKKTKPGAASNPDFAAVCLWYKDYPNEAVVKNDGIRLSMEVSRVAVKPSFFEQMTPPERTIWWRSSRVKSQCQCWTTS
jgi:hypothetical protein